METHPAQSQPPTKKKKKKGKNERKKKGGKKFIQMLKVHLFFQTNITPALYNQTDNSFSN